MLYFIFVNFCFTGSQPSSTYFSNPLPVKQIQDGELIHEVAEILDDVSKSEIDDVQFAGNSLINLYNLVRDYGHLYLPVTIHSRGIDDFFCKIFNLQHQSLLIQHKTYAYFILEFSDEGLSAREIFNGIEEAGIWIGTIDGIMISEVVKTAIKVTSGKKYSLLNFNCNDFVYQMKINLRYISEYL